ncbi:MAG: beta-lactamase family protein, partial [Caulobacteraceae bacterium]|nr:beta-lactamase family protein [Caulobacter sp.]
AQPPTPADAPAVPTGVVAGAALPATQAVVSGYVAEGAAPGMVAALGVGDAPTRYASAGRIAYAPGAQAAGPDSLWRVYSMTKPVTAAAAMILIEEGKLRLDAPLSDYIPAFAHMRVLVDPEHSLATRPATRPITIRNLLTHTAGMVYAPMGDGPLQMDYRKNGVVPLTIDRAFEDKTRPVRAPTLAEFATRMAAEPLAFEPGTQWRYSESMDLMGRVIEVASGMSFDRFVQRRIFDPLGMRSSFWTVPARDAGRLATNYVDYKRPREVLDPGPTSLWLSPPSFPYGGAGLVMSARDYDTFLHMLQDGGAVDGRRVMRPETVRLMMSNLLPPGVTFGGVNGTGRPTAPGGPTGFGAGGSVYVTAGPGGYPGVGTYGWGGAAGSVAWVDPQHHARGVMMVNVQGGVPGMREAVQKAQFTDERRLADR